MKGRNRDNPGFSLVEVTLALGVAGFCLIAVFGLVPVGVQVNRNAMAQTAADNILAAVIADMRATPKTIPTSAQFGITFGTPKTLYVDGEGKTTTSIAANSRYQLQIAFPPSAGASTYASLKVTWPAGATPANASGSVVLFAAFDRN